MESPIVRCRADETRRGRTRLRCGDDYAPHRGDQSPYVKYVVEAMRRGKNVASAVPGASRKSADYFAIRFASAVFALQFHSHLLVFAKTGNPFWQVTPGGNVAICS